VFHKKVANFSARITCQVSKDTAPLEVGLGVHLQVWQELSLGGWPTGGEEVTCPKSGGRWDSHQVKGWVCCVELVEEAVKGLPTGLHSAAPIAVVLDSEAGLVPAP
jgi:hypothetical protein